MSTHARIERALAAGDYAAVVQSIPYAGYLGIQIELADGARLYTLPYSEAHVGNARIPALHGGVVAGFMEACAQIEVLISQQQRRVPGPIDFNVDYLRSAKSVDSFVRCNVLRQGSRVAQVQAHCWQADKNKPVAFSRMTFLLQDQDARQTDGGE